MKRPVPNFAPADAAAGAAAGSSDPGASSAGAAGAGTSETAGAGAAAGAAAAASAAASTGSSSSASNEAGKTNPPAATAGPYRPDGLPDHLFGGTEKDTIDKLWKAYGGAREAIAKSGEVPKDVAGYALEPSEKVKPYAEGLDKDPFWQTTKELALKHGVGARTFNGLFGDLLEAMVDKSLVAEPFDPEKERAALVPDVQDPKARAQAADKIIRENLALVEAWKAQGLPEASAQLLVATMDRAASNQLVEWIRDNRGEQRPALTGAASSGASEGEVVKRLADPRNEVGNAKYDPAFAAETDRMARSVWGE